MRLQVLLLAGFVVFSGCKTEKEKSDEAYLALIAQTDAEYIQSPERAYLAQIKFAEYVKDSIRRGIPFPDRKVLVWVYPRIGLAAEYSGRTEEAARIFLFAESYAKQIYPGQPIDKSGTFKTLREAVLKMDRDSKIPWLGSDAPIRVNPLPNHSAEPASPSRGGSP